MYMKATAGAAGAAALATTGTNLTFGVLTGVLLLVLGFTVISLLRTKPHKSK